MKRLIAIVIATLLLAGLSVHTPVVSAAGKRKPPKPTPTPTATPTPTPMPLPDTDVGVVLTAPATVVSPGEIQYTVTATNYGPAPASDVQFCSRFSFGNNFALTGLFDQGGWSGMVVGGGSGRYTDCNMWGQVNSLTVGSSVTAIYTIVPQGTWPVTNTTEISSAAFDPVSTNSTETILTTLSP